MPRVALCFPIILLLAGCAAHPPGRMETAVAGAVKHRLTVGGRGERNPLPAGEETVASGRKQFSSYCANCHGPDAQNTGVPFAAAMAPPVPSLAAPEVQAYSDGQLHWIITNGLFPSGMPASRDLLHDEEIWEIVAYLRHLPPAGGLEQPAGVSPKRDPSAIPAGTKAHTPAASQRL
jgi:mono/diheme cytochrome c family protein